MDTAIHDERDVLLKLSFPLCRVVALHDRIDPAMAITNASRTIRDHSMSISSLIASPGPPGSA
jgi:hypothetical protein